MKYFSQPLSGRLNSVRTYYNWPGQAGPPWIFISFVHTYLMGSSLWELDGLIEGSGGRKFKQEGQLVVYRQDDLWSIDSRITILRPTSRDIVSQYGVAPFNEESRYAE